MLQPYGRVKTDTVRIRGSGGYMPVFGGGGAPGSRFFSMHVSVVSGAEST